MVVGGVLCVFPRPTADSGKMVLVDLAAGSHIFGKSVDASIVIPWELFSQGLILSVQQRADQSVGFSATNGHVPAGGQLLGEESAEPPMGQD